MASDINIKKPKGQTAKAKRVKGAARTGRPRRSIAFSSLARAIFLSNLVGLLILVIGALTLNEVRSGLIDAKKQNLYSQATLITNILASEASGSDAVPQLDIPAAERSMARITLPNGSRVRLFDLEANIVSDSALQETDIDLIPLEPLEPLEPALPAPDSQASETDIAPQIYPPVGTGTGIDGPARRPAPRRSESDMQANIPMLERAENFISKAVRKIPIIERRRNERRRNLNQEVRRALLGDPVTGHWYDDDDNLIVAVTIPVRRVQSVLGVIALESNDVQAILDGERRSLAPIAFLALVTAILSSLALTLFIALPIRRLARAAEIVRRSSKNRDAIPNLSGRRDEIGDLSVVLRDMTTGLYDRIDDIANFAADVAHEIKNPLTSLRSATETLSVAKTAKQREKLIGILQNDVTRMDRLITDISRASRMDAELARETGGPVEIEKMLIGITEFYEQTRSDAGPNVRYVYSDTPQTEPFIVRGVDEKLGQVFRNLIDNALTFSPPDGEIRLRVRPGTQDYEGDIVITVDDDGPGIPPANLGTIFERFYTERPKGMAFGSHSGLGLAICRQIIRAHRGTIFAANRTGPDGKSVTGAKFTVILPIYMP